MLDRRRTQDDPDTRAFHAAMQAACDAHPAVARYEKFKTWCDEYFYLKHRKEMRGIGGIFYDYLENDFDAAFAFTQEVGRAFLDIYPQLVRRNFATPWSEAERDELAYAVLDVEPHAAERLHHRLDVERFFRSRAQEAEQRRAQR